VRRIKHHPLEDLMAFSLERVCCLDLEASGLGERTYPIEAAVVDCATLECRSWLIRPTPRWLSEGLWSLEAAAMHGISIEELVSTGSPIGQVAAELVDCCRGKRVLCDGGEHDHRWLLTLFAGAGRNPPFHLDDFESFALEVAQRSGYSELAMADSRLAQNTHPTHRASADARTLAETLRRIAGWL
jgi:DNA polymerase III epsilon subunit-like protein